MSHAATANSTFQLLRFSNPGPRLCRRAIPAIFLWLTFPNLAATSPYWQQHPGYRLSTLNVVSNHPPGFERVSSQVSGIHFTNALPEALSLTRTPANNGGGVALGDIDGDGWCDIYLCSLSGDSRLYRNRGDWTFEDVTANAGVGCPNQISTGAVFADVDGDGDLDLLVNSLGGGTRLFLNDGHGVFAEKTDSGLLNGSGSTSLALADIDGDGFLDLYVVNYRSTTLLDQPQTRFSVARVGGQPVLTKINGIPVTNSDMAHRFTLDSAGLPREAGESDVLYRNDGHGRFIPIPFPEGFYDTEGHPAKTPYDWGLSAAFRDLNGDGAPDLYVCNDTDSPDRIWMNDGHGHFQAIKPAALRHTSLSSMGVDFADIDRDGRVDFFVVDMLSRSHVDRLRQREKSGPQHSPLGQWLDQPQFPRNTLFWNRGDGTFDEIALAAGLSATDWSWCPIFLDVDLDGYEDLLVSTGFHRNVLDADAAAEVNRIKSSRRLSVSEELQLKKRFPTWKTSNLAYRNLGHFQFHDLSHSWGFDISGVSQGMAVADLDNDGDLDVVINSLEGEALILQNIGSAPRLAVRLKGSGGNSQGIGAMLHLYGGPVEQSQEVVSGGHYLSGADPLRVFAAGSSSNLILEVIWRSGNRSDVSGLHGNELVEVDEAASKPVSKLALQARTPYFEDFTTRLNLVHRETPFDDFERQPLLPWRLSQLGPGVVWFDLNGDGMDDLIIGGGRGSRIQVRAGDGRGNFTEIHSEVVDRVAEDDLTGGVAWSAEPGTASVRFGLANHETGRTNGPSVVGWDVFFDDTKAADELPGGASSTGPLALADIDGDGDLDLFVGGRVIPGQYPKAASSKIYRSESGKLILDTANSEKLFNVGLVSGATWTDLNGDGFPELVLACEWGTVRVFANHGGDLVDATHDWGLDTRRGLWTGVVAGDLDGDGRMDLVVGNWGRNTAYEENIGNEVRLYHGSFDGSDVWNLIEAHWDISLGKVVPDRDWRTVARAIPWVQDRFSNFATYAQASVEQIYGGKLKVLEELRINTLDSMMFLNHGGKFEGTPLPFESQLSPVFGLCVGDYDGDGNEDLFLAQNFFGTDRETGRYDAGRGLWLQGDGHGEWRSVPPQESGIAIDGEQRGAALSDFNGDGRVDLVVSQNSGAVRLYRNQGGRPGLRVRLVGPPGNLTGLGAVLRLGLSEHPGPARELHAGGGYWSQDSSVVVLARPDSHVSLTLSVTWPGGRTQSYTVPADAREVAASIDGSLQLLRRAMPSRVGEQ